MSQQPGLDIQNTLRLLEAEFAVVDQQIKNQQGGSTADLMALREERDRLYIVFTGLDRQVNALQSIPTP